MQTTDQLLLVPFNIIPENVEGLEYQVVVVGAKKFSAIFIKPSTILDNWLREWVDSSVEVA